MKNTIKYKILNFFKIILNIDVKFQMIIEFDVHKTKINDIVQFNNTDSCSYDRTIKIWVN